ncbi:unnamed protein product [Hydatigera taeniaeformis]|uniref:Ig-like domain-containing protein n=1 Tax=Hydatigena taeniaeformis TaxID=6205 RepID=A0A0R3X3K4_HYDTA|nr:unnamed protein product [Hydatigera taeniaeformis]
MRSISPHWLNIQCTIPKSSSEFKVFITCPALPAPCYENCLPTQSCSEISSRDVECVPDGTAVNCTEVVNPDGSKLTSLWIDKRSPRLHGSWICTSLGVKSSVVNVEPELEESPVVSPNLEVLEESQSSNNTEAMESDKLNDVAGQKEENGNPPFYAITSRRRKYNEDQKTLGDMICLPTQMSRTQSGLWENDVYPSSFNDNLREPYYLKEDSNKIQHFGTFGPSNFTYEQTQAQNHTDFTDMAFPPYFNTVQPNNLWRTRSAVATFSPGSSSMAGAYPNHLRTDAASLNQMTSQSDDPPPPLPPQPSILLNQSLHKIGDTKQPLKPNTNLAPGITAVYDDVASSSSITMVSKDIKKPSLQMEPQLPSLVELEKPENRSIPQTNRI